MWGPQDSGSETRNKTDLVIGLEVKWQEWDKIAGMQENL